jgi:hypothetical protein
MSLPSLGCREVPFSSEDELNVISAGVNLKLVVVLSWGWLMAENEERVETLSAVMSKPEALQSKVSAFIRALGRDTQYWSCFRPRVNDVRCLQLRQTIVEI